MDYVGGKLIENVSIFHGEREIVIMSYSLIRVMEIIQKNDITLIKVK